MNANDLDVKIKNIEDMIGKDSTLIIKRFRIGTDDPLCAAILYINALVVKDIIDRDILNPLMFHVKEDIKEKKDLLQYVSESFLPVSNTQVINDINKTADEIKLGNTIVVIDSCQGFLMCDTTGGYYRAVSEPVNETVIKGSREGFVENFEANVSILRRRIKDKNLVIETMKIGKRTQTNLAIIYIKDIANINIVNMLREKLKAIDTDKITATGIIEQYLDTNKYNIFPQYGGTERPDKVAANITEGRIAIILEGTPYVITAPAVFLEFFQTAEDYNQRAILGSLLRLLRISAAFIVINFDAVYVSLIGGNNEFVPLQFVIPIAQARQNVALSIFSGLLIMEFVVELIREGGLRLPSKIGQTLSVVSGIIIGDAVVQAKIVSADTLFIVGVTTVASFLVNNYDMSLAVRFLRFPMIFLSNLFGFLGIAIGWFLLITYLCSLETLDVPYFQFTLSDMKDNFIRMPYSNMKKRPEEVPNIDPIRSVPAKGKKDGENDKQ